MLTFNHQYARYVSSLPREKRCACGQHPIARCPQCSAPVTKEVISQEQEHDGQLSFVFSTTPIYEER